MSDIFYKLFCCFPTIPLVGVVAIIFLTLMRVRRRLTWVIGGYLLLLSAALAFASTHRDEFGYSFIPALYIAWPWVEMLARPLSFLRNNLLIFFFGAAINCAFLYLCERFTNILGILRSDRRTLPPNLQESITKP